MTRLTTPTSRDACAGRHMSDRIPSGAPASLKRAEKPVAATARKRASGAPPLPTHASGKRIRLPAHQFTPADDHVIRTRSASDAAMIIGTTRAQIQARRKKLGVTGHADKGKQSAHGAALAAYARSSGAFARAAETRQDRYGWTEAEDNVIRAAWTIRTKAAGSPARRAKKHLCNRSISAIYARAHALGITRSPDSSRARWTKAEDDIIRAHYRNDGPSMQIAGRSRLAIKARAAVLGCRYARYQ